MQLFLSSSFSRGLSSIFCFVLSLSFIFEIWKGGGVAIPVTPSLDPPMGVEKEKFNVPVVKLGDLPD